MVPLGAAGEDFFGPALKCQSMNFSGVRSNLCRHESVEERKSGAEKEEKASFLAACRINKQSMQLVHQN